MCGILWVFSKYISTVSTNEKPAVPCCAETHSETQFALLCINICTVTVHQVPCSCSNNCDKIGRPTGVSTGSRNRRHFKLIKSNKFVTCKMSLKYPTGRSIICPKTKASHSKPSSSLANASVKSSSTTLMWKCVTVWSSHFQKVCLTWVWRDI